MMIVQMASMNNRTLQGIAIIALFMVGLFVGINALIFEITELYPPKQEEMRPNCTEIEMNDEFYFEEGKSGWVADCRGIQLDNAT